MSSRRSTGSLPLATGLGVASGLALSAVLLAALNRAMTAALGVGVKYIDPTAGGTLVQLFLGGSLLTVLWRSAVALLRRRRPQDDGAEETTPKARLPEPE